MNIRFIRSDNRDLIWETEDPTYVPLMGETVTVPYRETTMTGRVSTVHTDFKKRVITVTVRVD